MSANQLGEGEVRFGNTWKADGNLYIEFCAGIDEEMLTDVLHGLFLDFVVNNAIIGRFLSSVPGDEAWSRTPRTISIRKPADF